MCLLLFSPFCYSKITIYTEILYGYQYFDSQGEFVGPNSMQVKKGLQTSGIEYQINVLDWSVSYNAALRDKNSCIFSIARLPIREQQFHWIANLSNFSAYFYALPEKQIVINNVEQAKQYKTAVIESNFSHHFLMQKGFSVGNELIVIENIDKLFQLMSYRKELLDLIVLNDKQYQAKRASEDDVPELSPIYKLVAKEKNLYFACHKDMDKRLITKLKQAFKQ